VREPDRPRPTPSSLSRPFWDAARRGVLVHPRCASCARRFFTPQICCPQCLSEDWRWTESTGHGVVYSFAVCHRAPEPGFSVPYVLAIVDLEEGWSMLSNIVGCAPEEVAIGMAVDVAWERLDDEFVIPVFAPSGSRP
jgi:uncharacterized protein